MITQTKIMCRDLIFNVIQIYWWALMNTAGPMFVNHNFTQTVLKFKSYTISKHLAKRNIIIITNNVQKNPSPGMLKKVSDDRMPRLRAVIIKYWQNKLWYEALKLGKGNFSSGVNVSSNNLNFHNWLIDIVSISLIK